MQIKLKLEGKERTYSPGFISGMMLRRTFAIQKKMKDLNEDSLDEAVDYVVDLYGQQFTREQFYNGIDAGDMFAVISESINTVSNRTMKALGAPEPDPN